MVWEASISACYCISLNIRERLPLLGRDWVIIRLSQVYTAHKAHYLGVDQIASQREPK